MGLPAAHLRLPIFATILAAASGCGDPGSPDLPPTSVFPANTIFVVHAPVARGVGPDLLAAIEAAPKSFRNELSPPCGEFGDWPGLCDRLARLGIDRCFYVVPFGGPRVVLHGRDGIDERELRTAMLAGIIDGFSPDETVPGTAVALGRGWYTFCCWEMDWAGPAPQGDPSLDAAILEAASLGPDLAVGRILVLPTDGPAGGELQSLRESLEGCLIYVANLSRQSGDVTTALGFEDESSAGAFIASLGDASGGLLGGMRSMVLRRMLGPRSPALQGRFCVGGESGTGGPPGP